MENSKIIIFIQAYNENILALAKKKYKKYNWAFPIHIKNANINNPYFENKLYLEFDEIIKENNIDITQYEFIGNLSYKAFRKINLEKLHYFLYNNLNSDNSILYDYDFVHFFTRSNHKLKKVHKSFLNGGENFKKLWDAECIDEFGKMEDNIAAFSNYWMAKKNLFFQYCDFLQGFTKKLIANPLSMENGFYYGGSLKTHELILRQVEGFVTQQ